ncbi:MAG: polynucleotide adenylyltransferase, partial [Acidobacteria bacterium]|nr:polynucleotide adenylyltransferase [Acidobacteriota bacterium]
MTEPVRSPHDDASASTDVPDVTRALARAVRDAGGRAFIVGGWVRDRLLGHGSKDVDLEVYGIESGRLRALLERVGRVDAVGEAFTVYKVAGLDVSLPRRESKAGRGHRGFEVVGDPHMSVEEAARRRDFTINAILFDPLTGEYLDPFDGRRDLDRRVLRVVDERTFPDDSLRVLRALHFAARFDLTVDEATRAICRAIALDDLPSERVFGEVEKLLRLPLRPSPGFALALDLGVVHALMPEMAALVGCPQEPEWHPEGDVWIHTLMVIDEARGEIDDLDRGRGLAVMLGAVCHDFGKPATTAFIDGRTRSPNHEPVGVAPTLAFLDRLNVNTIDGFDVRHHVVGLTAYHLAPGMWHKSSTPVSDGAFRRLAQKVDLELLARFARADCRGRTGDFDCSAMDWFLERARALGVEHRPPASILMGRHLLAMGLTPGPRIGQIVKAVYERQLDGTVTNLDEALEAARDELQRRPAG